MRRLSERAQSFQAMRFQVEAMKRGLKLHTPGNLEMAIERFYQGMWMANRFTDLISTTTLFPAKERC